ncbi:MAG: type II toxin-antitoxin system HicB family antitoxin [Proteobacteria bacterium]|nr:type II toxin-antitoxin system HicB family antitoxin [Pseudomonadota bacterium]
MADRFAYPVSIARDGGRVLLAFPDLAGTATDAATKPAALAAAVDCLDEALAMRIADGLPIPMPSAGRVRVRPTVLVAAKAALVVAFRESGLSRAAFARKVGGDAKEAWRMLHPKHATKIQRTEAALRALGRVLVIDVRG